MESAPGNAQLDKTKEQPARPSDRGAWIRNGALLAFAIGVNVATYLLPIDYTQFAGIAIPGAFLITLVATGTILAGVPYIPVIVRLAQDSPDPWFIVIAAGLGSVAGESVSYLIGRILSGRVLKNTKALWLARALRSPWRAFAVLLLMATPPNPLFDAAGLVAGAIRVPYRVFFVALLLARLARFSLLVWAGLRWLH